LACRSSGSSFFFSAAFFISSSFFWSLHSQDFEKGMSPNSVRSCRNHSVFAISQKHGGQNREGRLTSSDNFAERRSRQPSLDCDSAASPSRSPGSSHAFPCQGPGMIRSPPSDSCLSGASGARRATGTCDFFSGGGTLNHATGFLGVTLWHPSSILKDKKRRSKMVKLKKYSNVVNTKSGHRSKWTFKVVKSILLEGWRRGAERANEQN